ncbi:MAG TPA: trehalose-phosphatase [Terracidiphilus sp.]|nr:trehalose-phosphatase [Terracidiphilus sp.]
MNEQTSKKLNAFFRDLKGAPHALLLLDYDGTLAGFRVDRFKARPWAGVRALLDAIQRQKKTRIAVVTGRPAEEIPRMLPLVPRVEVWGLHGAERLYTDGRRELEEQAPAVRLALEELRLKLKRGALGGLFEDKPNAAVMHWRGLSASQARAVKERTEKLFEPLARMDGLRLLEFEAGLELRAGRDKGGAVEAILRESDADAAVAYLGDDLTDEAAFRAVNAVRGPHLSVLMRRVARETDADVWLRPPEGMRMFLRRWAEARGAAATR